MNGIGPEEKTRANQVDLGSLGNGHVGPMYEPTAEPDIRPQLVSFFINPPSKLIDIAIMISM